MINSELELPDQLGGTIQISFPNQKSHDNFKRFLKFLATSVIFDGEEIH